MSRARRVFHPEPDHATKGAPSRSLEQKELVIHLSHVREKAQQKIAEVDMREALSEPIETIPDEHVKPEPSFLWALVSPKYLILLASDQSLFVV